MNDNELADVPPRILIVEDEPGNVENLKHKLIRDIPGVSVEAVNNVVDAHEKLIAGCDNQLEPDVLILDYMLPIRPKGEQSGNVSLGFVRNPDTLVIHATAYPNDPLFKRMMEDACSEGPKFRLKFEKTGDWAQSVVDACARHIRGKHSRRIRRRFSQLFGEASMDKPRHRASDRLAGTRSDRGRGLSFALFCQDAGQHWKDLDPDLQDLLARTVGHTTYEGRDIVGVAIQDDNVPDASPEESP